MPFDALVTNPGRLRILTALATEPRQAFVRLRQRTRLTDGNLATHAKRLRGAGLIAIDKAFESGKPVTSIELTLAGRAALEAHARHLLSVLQPVPPQAPQVEPADVEPADVEPADVEPADVVHEVEDDDDDWVD